MKRRRVLPLSDSLKLNDIGTRRNDASSSICYPRQACHPKITRVLARNGGGNKRTVIVVIGSMSLLNMALFAFVSGWGHLISFRFLPPWVWVILFGHSSAHCPFIMTFDHVTPNTAKSVLVPPICSREVDLCMYNLPLILHAK